MGAADIVFTVLLAVLIVIGIVVLIRIGSLKEGSGGELASGIDENLNKMRIGVLSQLSESQNRQEKAVRDGLISIQESTEKRLAANQRSVNDAISEGLMKLQTSTDSRLREIQSQVSEKLDKSLNERLDENFRQVGERLESLYRSLGELKKLESGVADLNKTLSNVKTRGVYGEMQLGNILAETLDKSQYDTNISTKPGSAERVEYAVKIPDKENAGSFIYLPIDAKFPSDIYNKIADAASGADAEGLLSAQKELKTRMLNEARTIRDKYVAPPYTTDFAVMFLPTEGLYSEALRIDNLAEDIQKRFKIILAGPMTVTALLNSLSVGFRYLTVNKKTEEIMRILGAFKTQFEKFDELIEQTQKSINSAANKTEKLKDRTRMIGKSLRSVEKLDYAGSNEIPEITEYEE